MKPSAKSSSTPQKRQWTESQEDGPLPVDVHTPENHDRKKKKRKHEAEEDSASPPPPASEPLTSSSKKKKKKKKEQEGQDELREKDICDAVETPMTEKKKKKKKKKEKRKSGPSEESVDTEAAEHNDEFINTIQEKKKKKQNIMSEESVDAEAADLTSETFTKGKKQKKRRSMQSEESIVTEEIEQNNREKKKKKKKKQEVMVAIVTPGHQNETTGASVTIETKTDDKKQKTPKKKKRDENVDEDTSEGELAVAIRRQSTEQTTRNRESAEEDDPFDPALLDELQEFIPDLRTRSAIVVKKLLRYDLARFKEFRKQGVPLRRGRCSEEENHHIRQNMADFMVLVGISSPIKLLFPKRFKGEETEIKKLKIQHHFFERLAEGIPRPCQQVYTRARKLFDDRNHMGRFSKEEIHSLIKLQNLYGNNWKAIAEKMDRSVHALEKRFATIAGDKGVWSPEEESRLKKALKAHYKVLVQQNPEGSGLTREQLCNNLPWMEISKKVGTRHWIQCRLKWFSILKFRMCVGGATFNRGPTGIQAKIQLINVLYNMQVDDSSDIDWDEVANTIGDVTSLCVQKSYYRLKASQVPNWTKLSFGEIIDYLHSKVIPILQEKLKKSRAQEVKTETQQQEITYQLSDIFSSQKEQEFVEVDNTQRSFGRSRH